MGEKEDETMTTSTMVEEDQMAAARALVDAALKRSGVNKAALREGLQTGFGLAVNGGHWSTWAPPGTAHDRAAIAAGRLLLRLRDDLHLPIEAQSGPGAIALADELLK